MEKKKAIKRTILRNVSLEMGGKIEDMIESLRDIEEIAMKEARQWGYFIKDDAIYLGPYFTNYPNRQFNAFILSEETDGEFEARLNEKEFKRKLVEKRKEQKVEKELKQLERLKEKYEKHQKISNEN